MLEGFVQHDGLRIYYAVAQQIASAEAEPERVVVLTHGWGSDSTANWRDTGWVEALTPMATVVLLDVRGHGRSSKPLDPARYSYASMSTDVLAVLDALQIRTADFLGYSMGAFMGAWLAGHHPDRLGRVVLGGIGDETADSAAAATGIAAALRAASMADIADPAGRGVRRFVAANPRNDLSALAVSALQMWPEGYPLLLLGDKADNAKMPILLVNGSADYPYVTSADGIAAALPDARHVQIQGTDHLTTVTDPRFVEVVKNFLG